MKCEIDIIVDRKSKWELKDLLGRKGVYIKEWFVEFSSDKSIISFEVEDSEEELLKDIYNILKNAKAGNRVILPDGTRISPIKEDFDRFYKIVCEYISSKE